MDAASNPFSPGAGLRPSVLAGRTDELNAFDALVTRVEAGRDVRGPMLTGLRGVGKTVLLNELARRADDRDWIVVRLEVARDGSRAALGSLSQVLASELRRRHGRTVPERVRRALTSIKAVSLTLAPDGQFTAGVDLELSASSTGDLELDLTSLAVDVGRSALEMGTGVLVCIDELQEMNRESLAGLTGAAHAAGQRQVPFVLAGAGLPNLPGRLATAKSYAERLFDYRPLGPLGRDAAAVALTEPVSAASIMWERDALDLVIDAAGGYPYFLQEFGASTWTQAAGPDRISPVDASNGVRLGQVKLDGGFFRARWDRATPTERDYLVAMSVDNGAASATPVIATRLGRTQSNLGPVRAGLIGKGLIYSPEYGQVAFTVPGMAGFVRRRTD